MPKNTYFPANQHRYKNIRTLQLDQLPAVYNEIITNVVLPAWSMLKAFANSTFTISLAGVFAGAMTAQKIAERSKIRNEITKELRDTNVGATLAIVIANLAMAIKRQYVLDLKTSYDKNLEDYDKFMSKKGPPITPTMNLCLLQEISPPIIKLEDIVFNHIAINTRAIAATTALTDAINNLNNAIAQRNQLIANFKLSIFPKGASINHMYFGIPFGEGNTNQEYGATVESIFLYTNDAIYFSTILVDDLSAHGKTLLKNNKKILRGSPLKIVGANFDQARQDGLIPTAEDYPAWNRGYESSN